MPPGKNRLDNVEPVAEKRRKKSREPATDQLKDPDADVESEAEDVEEDDDGDAGTHIGGIYIPPRPAPACTMDANGPRLVITHIDNINFKSYAGKQVLGPFHKSFTSIIGPNGSGKSNVIDSMLFVFGYRAQKIRSKSVAVLIHNSENHPNVQSCSVAVHFQMIEDINDDDFSVVPGSQFVVSRTAFKDNSSFYQVNGKRVQFKHVAKLLRNQGIDLDHNRFLILQGEVEQIAMMKPKAPNEHEGGMLEFLEDIMGTSRYKEPTEILSQRVETLNTQRTEKLNRVKLVEKEKDELEGPKNEAMAYIKLENEHAQLKFNLQQLYHHQALKVIADSERKKEKVNEEMGDLKSRLEELTKFKAEKNKEFKECSKEYEDAHDKLEKSVAKVASLIKEDEKMVEDYKLINTSRKKAKETIITEKTKLEELNKIPERNTKEIEEIEKVLADLEKKKEKEEKHVNEIMANLHTETQGLQDEKQKFELELLQLKKAVNETQAQMDVAQSELDIYLSTEKKEKGNLDSMKEQLEKVTTNSTERRRNLQELEGNQPNWAKSLSDKQAELQKITNEDSQKSEELRNIRIRLEQSRSTFSANNSRGRVLDSLMEQKRKGTLPGIFGRLGDLGAIDEKYDVAISTGCGSLDHVLVDTVDTAQKCIQYLKQSNLGRGSFLALEKVQHLMDAANRSVEYPENVPRLYDLIRVKDERVKPAFYHGVRETLVATDLDQATRIGYGRVRYRIITLKGDLIEPAGTMSGGGKTCLRGKMGRNVTTDTSGSEVSARDIALMEEKMQKLNEECSQLRQRRQTLEDELVELTKLTRQGTTNLQKWNMEIKALEEQQKALKEQITIQSTKVADSMADKKRVKAMEAAIAEKRKDYDAANETASKIETKVQKVHSKIMELTEGKMNKAREKLDAVTSQIAKLSTEKTKLGVAIKTSERNSKKSQDKIATLEQEVKDAENELRQLQERRKEIEQEAMSVKTSQETLEATEKEMKQKLTIFKAELDAALKEENKVRAEKIDYDQKMEKFEEAIASHRSKAEHWKREMGKIKLQAIDGNPAPELKLIAEEDMDAIRVDTFQNQITRTEAELAKMSPNLQAIADYRKKEEIYLARVAELDDVTRQRDEERKNVDTLRKARLSEFMEGFAIITTKLKELYQMITLGGDAELELVDSLDPFSEGIVFSVRPPKKTWKNISNLSGGEKTLSSLALVFALHYYKPTPLYVMDEIDAALDFKNVSIVGNYIKERTRNAQFIIISLRSNMFELADRLVGIYKTHNTTKSVAINPNTIEKRSEIENSNPATNSQTNTPPVSTMTVA